jgi:hypothetical protein
LTFHVINMMWFWDVLVCAIVDMAGAHSVVGDVALHHGGGPLVLVWGGDGDGGHWQGWCGGGGKTVFVVC